jgi:small acid-soluble spore protein A (major alpha-type SASP)
MTNTNKLLVPGSEQVLEQMKAEIAQEFGVQLGADATARQNGSVGGEMTKRLIALAQAQLANKQ